MGLFIYFYFLSGEISHIHSEVAPIKVNHRNDHRFREKTHFLVKLSVHNALCKGAELSSDNLPSGFIPFVNADAI